MATKKKLSDAEIDSDAQFDADWRALSDDQRFRIQRIVAGLERIERVRDVHPSDESEFHARAGMIDEAWHRRAIKQVLRSGEWRN